MGVLVRLAGYIKRIPVGLQATLAFIAFFAGMFAISAPSRTGGSKVGITEHNRKLPEKMQ